MRWITDRGIPHRTTDARKGMKPRKRRELARWRRWGPRWDVEIVLRGNARW